MPAPPLIQPDLLRAHPLFRRYRRAEIFSAGAAPAWRNGRPCL